MENNLLPVLILILLGLHGAKSAEDFPESALQGARPLQDGDSEEERVQIPGLQKYDKLWDDIDKKNHPSTAPTQPTRSILLLGDYVKGIKDLPELSKYQADLFEKMNTISPEDRLYKQILKEGHVKHPESSGRNKRTNDITLENVKDKGKSGGEKDVDEGQEPEEEIEIELGEGKRRRESQENADSVSEGYNAEEISVDEKRDTGWNILASDKRDKRFRDAYSNPDYLELNQDDTELPKKTEEGDESIIVAGRNKRGPYDFDSEWKQLVQKEDPMSESDEIEMYDDHDRRKRGNKPTSKRISARGKSKLEKILLVLDNIAKNPTAKITPTSKPMSARAKSKHELEEVLDKIAKNPTANISDEKMYQQLRNIDKIVNPNKLKAGRKPQATQRPNISLQYTSTVLPKRATTFIEPKNTPLPASPTRGLKQIANNIGKNLSSKVNDVEFSKELDDTLKAVHKPRKNFKKLPASSPRKVTSKNPFMGIKYTKVPQKRFKSKKKARGRKGKRRKWKGRRWGGRRQWRRRYKLRPLRYRVRLRYKRKKWTTWGSWGACSATCRGLGVVTRRRYCLAPRCVGRDYQRKRCYTRRPCPTLRPPLGRWLKWSAWSTCSVTCSLGLESQRRECTTSRCRGRSTRKRHCIRNTCNAMNLDEAKYIVPGKPVQLHCIYNHKDPVKKIYWVTPKGYNIYQSEANPRIKMDTDYLYIGRPSPADKGVYHCVIVRHSGTTDTADAPLEVRSCRNHDACLNGGVCVDYKHHWGYKCICPVNYSGKHCEKSDTTLPMIILLIALPIFCGILLFIICFNNCGSTDETKPRKWKLPKMKKPFGRSRKKTNNSEGAPEESRSLLAPEGPEEEEEEIKAEMFVLPEHPGRNIEPIYDNIADASDGSSSHLMLGIKRNAFSEINKDSASKLRPASNSPKPPEPPPPRSKKKTFKPFRDRFTFRRTNPDLDDSEKTDGGAKGSRNGSSNENIQTSKKVSFSDMDDSAGKKVDERSWEGLPDLREGVEKREYMTPRDVQTGEPGEESYMVMTGGDGERSMGVSKTPEKWERSMKVKGTPVPKNWFSRKIDVLVKGMSPKKSGGKKEGKDDEEKKQSILEVAGIMPSSSQKRAVKVKDRSVQGPIYQSSLEIIPIKPHLHYGKKEGIGATEVQSEVELTPSGSPDGVYENPYAKWSPGGPVPVGPANMPAEALDELEQELEDKGLTPERSPSRRESFGEGVATRLFGSDENANNSNDIEGDMNGGGGTEKESKMEGEKEGDGVSSASALVAKVHEECVDGYNNGEEPHHNPDSEKLLIDLSDSTEEKPPHHTELNDNI